MISFYLKFHRNNDGGALNYTDSQFSVLIIVSTRCYK